jgi:Protein of unknown function (DUF3780)
MPSDSDTLGFGFHPQESTHHFRVHIPVGVTREVLISEHFSYDPQNPSSYSMSDEHDGQLKVKLTRNRWNAIAEDVRAELNRRLKAEGIKTGQWKPGTNFVARLLGKELVLLAWAIEEADPATIPTAIRNWLGLQQEERWWLYSMTNAATGHATTGKNRGWRKAVRYALTENPVLDNPRRAYLENMDATQAINLSLFTRDDEQQTRD